MPLLIRGLALALALASASCVTIRPRTEIVVAIDADPGVATDTVSLYVGVRGAPSLDSTLPFEERLDRAPSDPPLFPRHLTIVPRDEDATRTFEVTVRAFAAGGRQIGRAVLRGRFVSGRRTDVEIRLTDCCRTITCGADETCGDCRCVPAMIDPEADAGTQTDAWLDPSVDAPGLDAAQVPDAGQDAGPIGCDTTHPCAPQACHTVECVAGTCMYTDLCGAGTTCCNGECAANCDCLEARPNTVCRAARGDCDLEERCMASSPVCPPDQLRTGECRAAVAGGCDLPESCDGVSATCPANTFVGAGVGCGAGSCDGLGACVTGCTAGAPCAPAGMPCATGRWDCTGTPTCVPSGPSGAGTECRAVAGPCDVAERCDGTSMACPPDRFDETRMRCRDAAGSCDLPEVCSGMSAACPPDLRVGAGVPCRPAVGACDRAESCDGTSPTCPMDGFQPSTTLCAPAFSNECLLDAFCTGTSAECPPNPSNEGGACMCNGTCSSGTCNPNCITGFCCMSEMRCYLWEEIGTCPMS
ncbi:MAG: hypothetical protein K1X94_06635 [Sandaracinaceae bacterium]|nr:hypothetical protein [Sandaracinaceae bacterium]